MFAPQQQDPVSMLMQIAQQQAQQIAQLSQQLAQITNHLQQQQPPPPPQYPPQYQPQGYGQVLGHQQRPQIHPSNAPVGWPQPQQAQQQPPLPGQGRQYMSRQEEDIAAGMLGIDESAFNGYQPQREAQPGFPMPQGQGSGHRPAPNEMIVGRMLAAAQAQMGVMG